MSKWIAEFDLEDGDTMPEHMDLNYMGAKIDFHCRPMWIPVSERLPDIDEEVLVDDGMDRYIAWYVNDGIDEGWHSFDESYSLNVPILAWMPLPEPYKKESD